MPILNGQPLRRQVVAAACLLLLPFVAGAVWSANRTRSERQAEITQQAGSLAVTLAAYLDQYFTGLDSLASSLVRHTAVAGLQPEEATQLFNAVAAEQPLLLNVVLTDVRGHVIAAAKLFPGGDTEPQPYAEEVVRSGQPVVSTLLPEWSAGLPAVVLGYPVRNGAGGVVGVVGLGVNLVRLQSVFASVPLPDGSVVTLVNREDRVLTTSRDVEQSIGTRSDVIDRSGLPRTAVRTGSDHVERFYGDAGITRAPWVLSVGIPRSVVAARLLPLWRRNLVIAFSALGASLLLALWLAHVITRHLNRLCAAAQRIADGDFSPPQIDSVPNFEVGQLRDAFVTMASRLLQTRTALDRQVEQERKMNEALQSLQRQVVRQERLAAVGVLVSGVAHELNNPLQAILGTAELLERHPALDPAALAEVSIVKVQSGRARDIIRNLSRFSSQQSGPPALVDLREVIAEVVQLRSADLVTAGIVLDVRATSSRMVYANFTELEQVTLNFVINAEGAIQDGARGQGRIQIRLFDSGKKVRLEVLDDGPGVSAENEPRLFQPFFTTKPVGKGTGLGLSVSYGIIDSYGGVIGHCRNEWGGATFFFELPASAAVVQSGDDRSSVLRKPV